MQNWTSQLANSLAFVAGLSAVLGFAPLHWMATVLISCNLIYYLVSKYPLQTLKLQFLYALGFFGLGISWVFNSISEFGTANIVVASLITLSLIVAMALIWALPWYIWLYIFKHSKPHQAPLKMYSLESIIGFASLWVLSEWLRSWLLSGFPWLFLGYSSIDSLLGQSLKYWAPWVGVYGVSWAMVISALLLVSFFRKLPVKTKAYHLALLLSIGLTPMLLPEQTQTSKQTIDVALVQPNTSQHQKWQPQYRDAIIQRLIDLSKPIWQRQPTLVIWPEASIPLAIPKNQLAIGITDDINRSLLEANSTLLAGVPTYHSDTGSYNNSLVQFGATTIDYYDKVHLVPFGEYIPFQSLFNSLLSLFELPLPSQSAGDNYHKHLRYENINIAPNICYEVAFPDLIAKQAVNANLLVTVSNDSWFGNSWGPIQHMQIAQMRALENAKPLLRATSTGITAQVDHRGNIIRQLPQFNEAVLVTQIHPQTGNSIFSRTGSWPILLLCTSILLFNGRKIMRNSK